MRGSVDMTDEYLSTLETVQRLGCSTDNVRALRRSGRLKPAITTRAGSLFRRIDVEEFAAARSARGRR
jgi:hypothetical protein